MKFERDEAKNAANKEKHGISFERAKKIFEGVVLIKEDNKKDYGEIRFNAFGNINKATVILVCYTDRNSITRIISARPTNKKERKA